MIHIREMVVLTIDPVTPQKKRETVLSDNVPEPGISYRVLRTAIFFQNVKKESAMIFTLLIQP
jgi:hypothetical protein